MIEKEYSPKIFLFIFLIIIFNFFSSCSRNSMDNNYFDGNNEIVSIKNIHFYNSTVKGNSMEPTLKNGEKVIVSDNISNLNNLDIVILKFKTRKEFFVKRIIAKEGDKILFGKDGYIYLNNKKLEENYIKDKSFYSEDISLLIKQLKFYNFTIPKGKYLTLGDNRKNSFDGSNFGLVSKENILGKVEKINN